MTPAEWRKTRKAARKRHRDAESGHAGPAGAVQRPESVRRPAPRTLPDNPKGRPRPRSGHGSRAVYAGWKRQPSAEEFTAALQADNPGERQRALIPTWAREATNEENHRSVDRERVHVQGVGQSHSPAGAGYPELKGAQLGIPEEVEHGIRRKWNIDSGGSGTAVPEVVNARR